MSELADQVRALCPHDVSGYCECTAQRAANRLDELEQTLRQAREALCDASDNYYSWGMHDGNTSVDKALAAIDAVLGEQK